jgi:hypothetical protein
VVAHNNNPSTQGNSEFKAAWATWGCPVLKKESTSSTKKSENTKKNKIETDQKW